MRVATKDVKAIVAATFPNYKRREVHVEAATHVTFSGVNWSGGTKSEYHACTIDGKPLEDRVNMGGPAPWNNPFEGMRVELPQDVVIVEGGWFMGKTSMLRLHVHPENMPKLLPEK